MNGRHIQSLMKFNLSQLGRFLFVMVHDIPAYKELKPKWHIHTSDCISIAISKPRDDKRFKLYPTALKRQLLSDGITLLTIIPSILYHPNYVPVKNYNIN